jgi:UDP-N-acetylmuramoyl-L-alanyl-D-glutamate--2,6-diaminopimelate ligase
MSFFERIRHNPVLKKIYRLPGVAKIYHFKLALFGAVFFGFPSRGMTVIGVTGTKGKTTVVELLGAALEAAGRKTAVLSSVRVKTGGRDVRNKTSNSMPGRFFIQRFLRDAKRSGCTHAVIEVTSQGVVQQRHRFIEWNSAAITNIAPEHIESHGSFENYRDAKLAFMQYALRRGATAFVNADDERSGYFRENIPEMDTVLYSTRDIEKWPSAAFSALPGEFNRQNIATVAAVARKTEIPERSVLEALENFKGVPGRMEFVSQKPFRVVVDYAHTPDSLEAAYKALREGMDPGKRLIAVFGSCGGHRDKWKRPVMGEVAARYADHVILTNEDPYDEDPEEILRDIRAGMRSAKVEEIIDREEAILRAVSLAGPGDTVVMTGKGSETSIHVAGEKTIEWSDRKTAEEALKRNKQ